LKVDIQSTATSKYSKPFPNLMAHTMSPGTKPGGGGGSMNREFLQNPN